MRRAALMLVMMAVLGLACGRQLRAQVISPGKLSSAHAGLEGVRQCTECHELGQRGISNKRCLSCHTALKLRVDRSTGFHATVATDKCSSCHKEHLGRGFDVTRLDSTSFKHERTGFMLKGSHGTVNCRQCHAPKQVVAADVKSYHDGKYLHKTFLGLGTGCESCHAADSPHGSQLAARKCEDCHDEGDWKRAVRFDHDNARFKLSGRHREIECAQCHASAGAPGVRYTGLQFGTCASCHRDPHVGRMSGTCSDCHTTQGWTRVAAPAVSRSFDHSRTRFWLRGAHAKTACAQCHQPNSSRAIRLHFLAGTERWTFARPLAQNCASCHVDPHPAALSKGASQSCASCHGESGWLPVSYDVVRHNRSRQFTLTGAHIATPCSACHTRSAAVGAGFLLPERTCTACHAKADPHKGKFGRLDCGECHTTSDFRNTRFDHKYATGRECVACHAQRNPHEQQFNARGCEQCHTTESFRIAAFDHVRTAFPLDGAHARVVCAGCHKAEVNAAGKSVIRYRPLTTTCSGCHGGVR